MFALDGACSSMNLIISLKVEISKVERSGTQIRSFRSPPMFPPLSQKSMEYRDRHSSIFAEFQTTKSLQRSADMFREHRIEKKKKGKERENHQKSINST